MEDIDKESAAFDDPLIDYRDIVNNKTISIDLGRQTILVNLDLKYDGNELDCSVIKFNDDPYLLSQDELLKNLIEAVDNQSDLGSKLSSATFHQNSTKHKYDWTYANVYQEKKLALTKMFGDLSPEAQKKFKFTKDDVDAYTITDPRVVEAKIDVQVSEYVCSLFERKYWIMKTRIEALQTIIRVKTQLVGDYGAI